MRKVTKQAIAAFLSATPFRAANTSVQVLPNVTVLKLHGNEIAYLYNDPQKTLSITNAGWFSDTTKERLNGIPGVSISQKAGVWYLNGKEWDGKLIDIQPKTKVIFYIEKQDGQDVALAYFPDIEADQDGNKTCYSHIGQHSACSPLYLLGLSFASSEQYRELKKELEEIGYNLHVLNSPKW